MLVVWKNTTVQSHTLHLSKRLPNVQNRLSVVQLKIISCSLYNHFFWGIPLLQTLLTYRLFKSLALETCSNEKSQIFSMKLKKYQRFQFPGQSFWIMKLPSHFNLVPRLWECGAVPPFQHIFMVYCFIKSMGNFTITIYGWREVILSYIFHF